jgi:hypothetical protein
VNASKNEGVMVLELRNPPANTYSYDMMRAFPATLSATFVLSLCFVWLKNRGSAGAK